MCGHTHGFSCPYSSFSSVLHSVLWIHNYFFRIRIRGSVILKYGSGSGYRIPDPDTGGQLITDLPGSAPNLDPQHWLHCSFKLVPLAPPVLDPKLWIPVSKCMDLCHEYAYLLPIKYYMYILVWSWPVVAYSYIGVSTVYSDVTVFVCINKEPCVVGC